MKSLSRVLAFIFISILTILGLIVNKFYEAYIKNSGVAKSLIYTVVWLTMIRVALIFITPLVDSISSYIKLSFINTNILDALCHPLIVLTYIPIITGITLKVILAKEKE